MENERLAEQELATLAAAGYELFGEDCAPGGPLYIVFCQDDREVRSTAAEWRVVIAGLDKPPSFVVERRDDDIHTELYILLEDGPLRHWTAHRVHMSKYDVGDEGAILPQPRISLVGFGGTVDELPAYIASIQEVERQARALREEKHREYQEWRSSL